MQWLLVFRSIVGLILLVFAAINQLSETSSSDIATLLYTVSLGTFAVVFALALLLRMGYAPQILSTIHTSSIKSLTRSIETISRNDPNDEKSKKNGTKRVNAFRNGRFDAPWSRVKVISVSNTQRE